MSFTCPTCGRENYETLKVCICGHSFTDESVLMQPKETDIEKTKVKASKNALNSKGNKTAEETVIKEIDSWALTFSQLDECIYLGTPALQSFRLKLTKDDLEELLEFMYQKTGEEKTTRKLRLLIEEIPDLIHKVDRMIEEKKSKMALKFASEELQEIADLINMKLKE